MSIVPEGQRPNVEERFCDDELSYVLHTFSSIFALFSLWTKSFTCHHYKHCFLLCCADPYTPITPTSSHANVTHHTRGHTLRHTSSYTVYLAQPHSLRSFNYRSGSSVDICTCISQATHQQSRGGHASHARSHPATYIIIHSLSSTTPLSTII